jgi:hypothetical protein
MVILDYDSKAKKAALKRGLAKELQATLIYQSDNPEDFDKFVELCRKLNYSIRVYDTHSCCSNNSHPSTTKATPSPPCTLGHPTSSDSGNYSPTPMDLSTAKKSQNQCCYHK